MTARIGAIGTGHARSVALSHVSGNRAAVESFARSDYGEKHGVLGVGALTTNQLATH
jgi:hypothetical protein